MQMPSTEQRRSLEEAVSRYSQHLHLAQGNLDARGIDQITARRADLGVVVDPVPGHEHLRGRLAIPYMTESGPVNMTFRCIEDHDCKVMENHSKYRKVAGSPSNLYGVRSYREADSFLALCEGEIDTIILKMIGIPAMGVPGADMWKPHWNSILQDFSRVYVFSDGDKAGKDFANRVMVEYEHAIDVPMPPGEDVNSIYVKFGKQALLDRIKE